MAKRDAIALIEQDHRKLRGLLDELMQADEADAERRRELLDDVAVLVEAHSAMEEQVFYPAVRDAIGGREAELLFHRSLAEHQVTDWVCAEAAEQAPSSVEFSAFTRVLRDTLEHHLEEEEREILPRARRTMSDGDLAALVDPMEDVRSELIGEPPGAAGEEPAVSGEPVHINSADEEELRRIEGIDRARARHLVEYRESHGPFRDWDDLLGVPGFDGTMVERVRASGDLR